MHELSLCLALLEQVQTIAADHNAHSVERIQLHIGPLSGVEASLLASAWPLVAIGTIAATAVLDITMTPVRIYCYECHCDSETTPNQLNCRACGSYHTQVKSGRELLLAHLDLQTID